MTTIYQKPELYIVTIHQKTDIYVCKAKIYQKPELYIVVIRQKPDVYGKISFQIPAIYGNNS